MSAIVVTGNLRDQLKLQTEEAELRDESGNVIGRFVPLALKAPDLDISDEEVRQLLAPDRKIYTTAEVLAHLKSLTP